MPAAIESTHNSTMAPDEIAETIRNTRLPLDEIAKNYGIEEEEESELEADLKVWGVVQCFNCGLWGYKEGYADGMCADDCD